MGKISEIFDFDNIGGKIKNLAKWSCWTTILLIWIAAPISFIVLVSDDWTAELCWIPLVGAIVGPIFVWLGSWAMYAFGEFVEDTHAIRNKYYPTEEEKAKQKAAEKAKRKAEEKAKREAEEKAKCEAVENGIENNDEENVETFDSVQEKGQLLSEEDIKTKNGVLKKYYGNNKYIIIPDNITGIERDSFEFANNLIGVIMHDSITNIGSYAFNGCKNLSTVILSKGITTLRVGTFSGCYSLANIMIPASVTYIERDAFENCGKFIVHTVEGSYAEKFARENGIEVTLI